MEKGEEKGSEVRHCSQRDVDDREGGEKSIPRDLKGSLRSGEEGSKLLCRMRCEKNDQARARAHRDRKSWGGTGFWEEREAVRFGERFESHLPPDFPTIR